MKNRRPKPVGGVSTQRLHERVVELEHRLATASDTIDVIIEALSEVTLQAQFLLRSITDKQEVVGLLDIKPRVVTVRLLDIYKKKKPAIIKELENERKSLAEAQRRDTERLLTALKEAGIDPDDAAAVDAFLAQANSTATGPEQPEQPPATNVPDAG